MIYADSSFIVSLYGNDNHTALAVHYCQTHKPKLPFAFMHWPEVAGSLFKNWKDAENRWNMVREDLESGMNLYRPSIDAQRVGERAAGMMRHFVKRWPKLRSVDVMHVAAAVENQSREFLSFDTESNQRILAHAQKLKVWPPLTEREKGIS